MHAAGGHDHNELALMVLFSLCTDASNVQCNKDTLSPEFNPLTPSGATWVQLGWASECPDVKNYKWWLNPAWHRMLYSCTHVAPLGVKGLKKTTSTINNGQIFVFFFYLDIFSVIYCNNTVTSFISSWCALDGLIVLYTCYSTNNNWYKKTPCKNSPIHRSVVLSEGSKVCVQRSTNIFIVSLPNIARPVPNLWQP